MQKTVAYGVLSLAALCATVSGSARAADSATTAPTGAVSLTEALAFALKNQPEVLAAKARLLAARAAAQVPGAAWLPTVGALAEVVGATTNNSTATVISNAALDLPRIGGTSVATSNDFAPHATTLLGVGVRQELFDFGRIAAETAAASARAAVDEQRARAARLDTILTVTEAYYAVLAARAVLDVATRAQERAQLHRDYAQAGVMSGLRAPIDLTRAKADLTRFAVSRIRAEGSLRVAKSVLAAAVGVAAPELDAKEAPDMAGPLPSRYDVQAQARDADPAVRSAIFQARAQRLQTEAIERSSRPNLFVTAAISGRAGGAVASNGVIADGDGWLPSALNYSAALVLEWPIYRGTSRAQAEASRRTEQARLTEVEVARRAATTRAEQVYRNLEEVTATLDALARAADAAKANHEQAEARFRAGLGTSTELADAETLRIDAEIELAVGHFQVAVARAALARAMSEEP
ncbi:MAG TPA: TolC family protein [Polyangiaceae bacterium]|nr:TolC family protein [Polyangiaceae bacterium]